MARPTVMTAKVIHKLEEAFALGCSDLEASLYADISPATLYNHQDKNPEFLERKEQLKMKPVLKARKTVVDSLDNPELAFKYLERRKKDEFSTRRENDITTNGSSLPVPILGGISIRTLSDEKLDALIERFSEKNATEG